MINGEVDLEPKEQDKKCSLHAKPVDVVFSSGPVSSNGSLHLEASEIDLPIHSDSTIMEHHNHTDDSIIESVSYEATETCRGEGEDRNVNGCLPGPSTSNGFTKISPVEDVGTAADVDMVCCESSSSVVKDVKIYCNGHIEAEDSAMPVEEANEVESGLLSLSGVKSGAEIHGLKRDLHADFEMEMV